MQIAVLYLLLTSCMIHIYAITSSSTSSSTGDHIIEFDDNSIQPTLELADFPLYIFILTFVNIVGNLILHLKI